MGRGLDGLADIKGVAEVRVAWRGEYERSGGCGWVDGVVDM